MKGFSILLALLWAFALQAQNIDSQKSTINFKVGNLGILNVKGTFNEVSGIVALDSTPAHIDALLSAASINTGNEKRDIHLRSEDFFEVVKFPSIRFVSQSIRVVGDKYVAQGQLFVKDKVIDHEFEFYFTANRLTATFEVSRKALGIGSDFGTFMAGDKVTVELAVVVQ